MVIGECEGVEPELADASFAPRVHVDRLVASNLQKKNRSGPGMPGYPRHGPARLTPIVSTALGGANVSRRLERYYA